MLSFPATPQDRPSSAAETGPGPFTRILEAADLVHPGDSPGALWKRCKFVLRALLGWKCTLEWLDMLDEPGMAAIVAANPRLREKLQRPYLHRGLSIRQRLTALRTHYRFLARRLGAERSAALHAREPCALASLPVGEEHYRFTLGSDPQFEKEGEMALCLRDSHDRRLMTLVFSIGPSATGDPAVLVGCIQGPAGERGLDLLRQATRALHGLRPVAAALAVLQMLAVRWQLPQIRAASDHAQVDRHWRYALRGERRTRRYDEIWLEAGGTPGFDDWWNLPTAARRRDMADIPSQKRSQYRRRYAMLDDLERQLAAF